MSDPLPRHRADLSRPWWPLRSWQPWEAVAFLLGILICAALSSLWVVLIGFGFVLVSEAMNRALSRVAWKRVESSSDPVAELTAQDWYASHGLRATVNVRRWVKEDQRREQAGEPPEPFEDLHADVQDFIRTVAGPPKD